jgi:hypothetical protein
VVYKYFPPQRSAFLYDPLISFSPPSLLNDPYECRPVITLKDIDRHIENLVQRNYERAVALYGNSEKTQNRLKLAADQTKRKYQDHPETVTDMVLSTTMKHVNTTVGILSLVRTPDNELMWAHYTASHQGFVVGFDESNEFFKRRANDPLDCGILKDVQYTDEQITIDVDNIVIPQQLLFTKRSSWSYEGEVRMIRALSTADKVIDKGNQRVFLFRVPKESIKEVIFGLRSATETVDPIVHTVKGDPAYGSVVLKKINIDVNGNFQIVAY